MSERWAVFAGPAWRSDQDSPDAHLVGLFPSLRNAQAAFARMIFRQLPIRHGRLRWRGTAPFGAAIVQIEQLRGHRRGVSAESRCASARHRTRSA